MARTKEEKLAAAEQEQVKETKETTEAKKITKTSTSTTTPSTSTTTPSAQPSYEDLLQIVQSLSREINALKSQAATAPSTQNDATVEVLTKLANRKSDREVVIVHNCEMNGGLTTHLQLTGLGIDFRHVGEQRVVNWQQFEECVSKYHSFFERRIILLGEDYAELADTYGIPHVETTGAVKLTSQHIAKLPTMSIRQLEDLVNALDDADKAVVFNYWLGKCYTKEANFYDRAKIEALNRLSKGAFTTLLLVMNGDNTIIED